MTYGLKFDEHGLIPAIIQDHNNYQVLMLGHMNEECITLTLQSNEVWLYDQLGNKSVNKNIISGYKRRVVDITQGCNGDAIIVQVEACRPAPQNPVELTQHNINQLGNLASPEVKLVNLNAMEFGILIDELYRLIHDRKKIRPEGFYTTYLFNAGLDKILKKIGEEVIETVIAAKNVSKKELSAEISDMFYHLLVLSVECEIELADILKELKNRVR